MTDYNTREAVDEIIPELAKLFKKRRWEAESVYIALDFFSEGFGETVSGG